jgi:hypothetical protein
MVDTIGFANSAPAPTTLTFNGRQARQLNGVAFGGATAARPLGALTGVRPGTSTTTVTATSTTWTCGPFAGLADLMVANESGAYPFSCDAVATGSMTPANTSFPRADIICVTITDPENGSTTPTAVRQYVAGTVNTSGTLTAVVPAQSFVVAVINVPKLGTGSPSVTWVAPYATAAGAISYAPTFAVLSTYPGVLYQQATVFADPIAVNNGTYIYSGSTWVAAGEIIDFQADTSNSKQLARIQTGIGKVAGTNGASISETVTFPAAFSGIPVVTLSYSGARLTGAYNPAGLTGSNTGVGASQAPSTTGFIAALSGVGTYASANDYYYSWIAIGPA